VSTKKYAVDGSFPALKDKAELDDLNRKPTSFALPAELRCQAWPRLSPRRDTGSARISSPDRAPSGPGASSRSSAPTISMLSANNAPASLRSVSMPRPIATATASRPHAQPPGAG